MMPEKKNIALIQFKSDADPKKNLQKGIERISEAAEKGAQVILLQELFTTLYFCREMSREYFRWAEPIPGPVSERLCRTAEKYKVVILAPLFEKEAAGVYYNSSAVIDADGSLRGVYRKMHIPDDPGFYEKYYFTPGDTGYKVFETAHGRIGTLICWDQWFPEAARLTAMKGADLLVYPTAIGTLSGESEEEGQRFLDAWLTIQRSHAIANGCFVAGINRVGNEGGTRFWGHSFVAGPFGEMVAEAGGDDEILLAGLDYSKIEIQRQNWPFFRDRRTDSYNELTKRWIKKPRII